MNSFVNEPAYKALLTAEAAFWDSQIPAIADFRPDLQYLGSHMKVDLSQATELWDDPQVEQISRGPVRDRIYSALSARPGGKVMELGCGVGWLALELARRGFHVKGIDISSRRIAIAEAYAREFASDLNGGSLEYQVDDLNRVSLESESLDAVVAWECLHHMVDIEYVIAEVARALRPGGLLLAYESIREPGRAGQWVYQVLHFILPTLEAYPKKWTFCQARCVSERESRPSPIFSPLLSPLDGYTGLEMLDCIGKHLEIMQTFWKFAFCAPLLGRLRGGSFRLTLVRMVERLDAASIKLRLLPGTHLFIHACKLP